MNIHEYQAKQVLKAFGAPVAEGVAITSADQAEAAAKQLPGPLYVVKSQIHAGGRGKGKFKELPADAKGGVRLAFSIEDVVKNAKEMLGNTLVTADARRRRAERQLQQSREETARMNGELDAAKRIQTGLLPDTTQLFAGEERFALGSLLEPARAVGGDYYDCFMLDASRLCLAIGDVSGKGLPASLFMAISKTLTGTLTRRHRQPGEALQDIEIELNRDNCECLFVTAFVGILDVDTGQLEYACAGHDAPVIRRNGQFLRIDT